MNDEIRSIAEQCSQPSPGIPHLALLQLRPYIESFFDPNWLDSKLRYYREWASKNSDPFLQRSLLHRPLGFNMLVASIWAARNWENIYKEDPNFRPSMGAKRLANIASSLAVLELHAGHLLDFEARRHMQERLQATDLVWGVINELHAFAYFARKGAEVQPHFLQKASPREITVRWQGVDIPVQCKVKHPGAGRLISQDVVTTLSCCIARDARIVGKKLLVRIGTTGPIRQDDVEFLRHQVSSGIGSGIGPALVTHRGRTFTVKSKPLSGQFTPEAVRDYLSSYDFHVGMVIGEPTSNENIFDTIAVVGIEANPIETPWRSLRNSIKDGARQLGNGPLGVIAIYYTDPVVDFEALCPDPGYMKVFVGQLIDKFPYVGAVIMASEPDLQLLGEGDPGRVRIYYKKPWPFPPDFLMEESD